MLEILSLNYTTIHQEKCIILTWYASNNVASKYIMMFCHLLVAHLTLLEDPLMLFTYPCFLLG